MNRNWIENPNSSVISDKQQLENAKNSYENVYMKLKITPSLRKEPYPGAIHYMLERVQQSETSDDYFILWSYEPDYKLSNGYLKKAYELELKKTKLNPKISKFFLYLITEVMN